MKNLISSALGLALFALIALSTSVNNNPFQAETTISPEVSTADLTLEMDARNTATTTLSTSSSGGTGTGSATISSSNGGSQSISNTVNGTGSSTISTGTTGGVSICDYLNDPYLRGLFGCN